MSTKSVSYQLQPKRIRCDQFLNELTIDYLEQYGEISSENREFIQILYANTSYDTWNVVKNLNETVMEKLVHIIEMLDYPDMKEMLKVLPNDSVKRLRQDVWNWLLRNRSAVHAREIQNAEKTVSLLFLEYQQNSLQYEEMNFLWENSSDILDCLIQGDYRKCRNAIKKWTRKHGRDNSVMTKVEYFVLVSEDSSDGEMFSFFLDVYMKRPQSYSEVGIDHKMRILLSEYPILKGIGLSVITGFGKTVRKIIEGQYESALELFLNSTNVEIADGDEEDYYWFAQNLSALAENASAYVYFTEEWIGYLENTGQMEAAGRMREEYGDILAG